MDAVQPGTYPAGTRPRAAPNLHRDPREFTLVPRCLFSHRLLKARCGPAPLLCPKHPLKGTQDEITSVYLSGSRLPCDTEGSTDSLLLPAGNLACWQGCGRVGQLGSNGGFFRSQHLRTEIRDLNDLLCVLQLRRQGRVLQGTERGAKQVPKVVSARGRHPGDSGSVYSELACSHRPQMR